MNAEYPEPQGRRIQTLADLRVTAIVSPPNSLFLLTKSSFFYYLTYINQDYLVAAKIKQAYFFILFKTSSHFHFPFLRQGIIQLTLAPSSLQSQE